MSSPQSTWRVLRASRFRDLRGQSVTLTYDDGGIGIVASGPPAALTVPWHSCHVRLTRRSSTWEMSISGTPWGEVTLATFRPAVSPKDLEFWESHGVLWSRWRWTRLSAVSVAFAVVSYVGLSILMNFHSVARMSHRSLPTLSDVPFAAHVTDDQSGLSGVMYPPRRIFTNDADQRRTMKQLVAAKLLRQHSTCTGVASSRDRILGRGGPVSAASEYSSVFQSTSDPSFRVGVLTELFGNVAAVRRDGHQLSRSGMTECVAATYGRLVMWGESQSGRVTSTAALNLSTLSRAEVHAARATVLVGDTTQEILVALVTYDHFRVTVVGVGANRESAGSRFSQMVSMVAHKIAGDAVTAA